MQFGHFILPRATEFRRLVRSKSCLPNLEVPPVSLTAAQQAAHATSRFGLGAKPNTLRQIGNDPQGWLAAQIGAPADTGAILRGLPGRAALTEELAAFRESKRARKNKAADLSTAVGRKDLQQLVLNEINARVQAALTTELPLQERLVRFWSNHFTVSVKRIVCAPFAGLMEREAIRPHIFSPFETMLQAVAEHPAMLLYLDNATSIGPNSPMGERRGKGLNENLAREILELHTLGVDGGYSQADVTAFARALTGWTFVSPQFRFLGNLGDFYFNERGHEPGTQTILSKPYAEAGVAQGKAVLRDLARHPATARHLATKLARHFISDEPPEEAINRLADVYRRSGGDLAAVTRALIAEPAAWEAPLTKLRSTEDYVLATWRALNINDPGERWIKSAYYYLGQTPFTADSPAGWGDRASDWAGPDAVMKRITWADAVCQRLPSRDQTDLVAFGQMVLGGLFNNATAAAMTRAASRPQALTLLLTSPEMMRR